MKWFSIQEMCYSQTAIKYGINNQPNKEEEHNIICLVDNILDPLRELYGKPIIVNSGFRCSELNKLVGGSQTSQHKKGLAADIRPVNKEDMKLLFELAKTLDFDQLLDEYNLSWIHISWSEKPRHQILKAKKVGGRTVYEKRN